MKKILLASIVSGLMLTTSVSASDDMLKLGKKVFNSKKLGNCLACHDANGKKINGPGSMGPVLTGLKYWPEETLYDTVYDISAARGLTNTSMPSFGAVGWLSDKEIKAVVQYIKTIE